jgi:hypothetical protein
VETRIPTEARARLLGAALGCAAWCSSVPSFAQPAVARSSLVVTRGEGADDCPDAANLAEQVQRLSGASGISAEPLSGAPSDTWIQVAIVHNFGGYRAEINAGGLHHGSRSLEDLGPGCASLADAITITIAIFLDPYVSAAAPRPATTAPATPTPLSVQRKREPSLPEHPWRQRLTLDLAGGASLNVLEHTEPLLTARVGWRAAERWSLAVGGTFLFPDSVGKQAGTVELGLSYVTLMGCARALGSADGARVDWCGAMQLGSLRGSGHGYENTLSERAWWAAVAVGPEIIFPFTPWLAWSLGAFGVVPLVRQEFDVELAGERSSAFRSPAVAAQLTLGVRAEL